MTNVCCVFLQPNVCLISFNTQSSYKWGVPFAQWCHRLKHQLEELVRRYSLVFSQVHLGERRWRASDVSALRKRTTDSTSVCLSCLSVSLMTDDCVCYLGKKLKKTAKWCVIISTSVELSFCCVVHDRGLQVHRCGPDCGSLAWLWPSLLWIRVETGCLTLQSGPKERFCCSGSRTLPTLLMGRSKMYFQTITPGQLSYSPWVPC